MNLNPFKNTYKIVECSSLQGEKYYMIKYGNIFDRVFILNGGSTSSFQSSANEYGGKFSTLESVKKVISLHIEKLTEKRLSKITSKTILDV